MLDALLSILPGLGFITLAAFFKAVADTCADHWDSSIFKKLNPKFWHKATSSEYARRIGGYKLDSWHIANSLSMAAFLALIFTECQFVKGWEYAIYGTWLIIAFNLSYNKILR